MNALFEVRGEISVSDVPDVRRFVDKFHRKLVTDADKRSRVAVATHELLENAIKFSADGSAWLRIEIIDGALCITTRNRARHADLDVLTNIARELSSAPDAMTFYLDLMQRSPADVRGGLGLGRVAAEGEMTIGLALDGDVVEVRATADFGPGC